jgi:hypothetical protein
MKWRRRWRYMKGKHEWCTGLEKGKGKEAREKWEGESLKILEWVVY